MFVLGRVGKVGGFAGVFLDVVELLVDRLFAADRGGQGDVVGFVLLFIKVADVFEAFATHGFHAWVVLTHEHVLGEEVLAPGGAGLVSLLLKDGHERAALHFRMDGQAGEIEQGGGNVDGEGELRGFFAALVSGLARVKDDQGHPQGFFIKQHLAAEAVLAELEAVIGGEDDDGVLIKPLRLEFGNHGADEVIDSCDCLAGAHRPLAQGGLVFDKIVACQVFAVVNVFGDLRGFDVGLGDVGGGDGHLLDLIAVAAAVELGVRGKLLHLVDAEAVWHVEVDQQAEGLVCRFGLEEILGAGELRVLLDEIQRALLEDLGLGVGFGIFVNRVQPLGVESYVVVVAIPVVEVLFHDTAVVAVVMRSNVAVTLFFF